MKRWNGWGDENISFHLSSRALSYIQNIIGKGDKSPDIKLSEAINSVPVSRITAFRGFQTDTLTRLLHARGQSLPDWIALRSTSPDTYPDAVAFPANTSELQDIIKCCHSNSIFIIPYGGGTSVLGHITPPLSDRPIMTVDLSNMNKLVDIETENHMATFECGITGPKIEEILSNYGYTLGHFPQSFEYSTLGGWIASRSCGQQSLFYGRIENMLMGCQVQTALGSLTIHPFGVSSAGPDLRQLVLGSEGRLGIIDIAKVKIFPRQEVERYYGAFFPEWENGVSSLKQIMQTNLKPSMLRLSDPAETAITLILSGKDRFTSFADYGLKKLGYGDSKCLLIYGIIGTQDQVGHTTKLVNDTIVRFGGMPFGEWIGKQWYKTRFRTPYLRNSLWENGYALDTVETVLPWEKVIKGREQIQKSISESLEHGNQRGLIFTHLSHVYSFGASVYTTFILRRQQDPSSTLLLWQNIKNNVSNEIISLGGTISHQHGVGIDHQPYMQHEKGEIGVSILESLCNHLDPAGLFNPGKLI